MAQASPQDGEQRQAQRPCAFCTDRPHYIKVKPAEPSVRAPVQDEDGIGLRAREEGIAEPDSARLVEGLVQEKVLARHLRLPARALLLQFMEEVLAYCRALLASEVDEGELSRKTSKADASAASMVRTGVAANQTVLVCMTSEELAAAAAPAGSMASGELQAHLERIAHTYSLILLASSEWLTPQPRQPRASPRTSDRAGPPASPPGAASPRLPGLSQCGAPAPRPSRRGANANEERAFFEALYGALTRAVQQGLGLKAPPETVAGRPKNNTEGIARSAARVEEELSRLFRSSHFGCPKAVKEQQERREPEGLRFDFAKEDAKEAGDASAGEDSGADGEGGKSSAVDALIARFRSRALPRQKRSSRMQGAANVGNARSPLLSSVLPSPREQLDFAIRRVAWGSDATATLKPLDEAEGVAHQSHSKSPRGSPKGPLAGSQDLSLAHSWALTKTRTQHGAPRRVVVLMPNMG